MLIDSERFNYHAGYYQEIARFSALSPLVPDFTKHLTLLIGSGQAMEDVQYDRWRNWIVGGLDDTPYRSVGKWFSGAGRKSAPSINADIYDFTKEINDRLLFFNGR